MSQVYPMNEQEWLTPPNAPLIDEEIERKKIVIEDAIYSLNECITELYSYGDITSENIAMDLSEFRQSIRDLERYL